MIKVIAFDLWNTLIYLEDGWRTFNQLKEKIPEFESGWWVNNLKPLFLCKKQESSETFLYDIKKKLGIDLNNYSKDMNLQLVEDFKNVKLFNDTLKTLSRLVKEGKQLVIVSNQCSFFIPMFKNLGLDKYFNHVLFSCNLGYRKPDKRIYQELLRVAKVLPEEILFVGDNYVQDFKIPIENGFKALHLNRKIRKKENTISSLKEIFIYI